MLVAILENVMLHFSPWCPCPCEAALAGIILHRPPSFWFAWVRAGDAGGGAGGGYHWEGQGEVQGPGTREHVHMYMYIYIYMSICLYVYAYMHMYIAVGRNSNLVPPPGRVQGLVLRRWAMARRLRNSLEYVSLSSRLLFQ